MWSAVCGESVCVCVCREGYMSVCREGYMRVCVERGT